MISPPTKHVLRVLFGGSCLCALLSASDVQAFAVGTSFSDPCHEKLVGEATLEDLFASVDLAVMVPKGDNWREVSRAVLEGVGLDVDGRSDKERFLLMSLVVGVRFPDTDGHSIMNLDTLRLVHSDPSALGTYAHCVRGPDDDYQAGNVAAIAGSRMFIIEFVDKAREYMDGPRDALIEKQEVYLDFYGLFKTEIFAPFFYLGRAAHVLQDCFSHTVRSEVDDLKKIVHVVNYVDAISDNYSAERDGLAHSDYMDRCRESDLAPLVDGARVATGEFFDAVAMTLENGDRGPINHVMDTWMSLKPGCDFDNDMCGNSRMLALAKRDPTRPYLEKIFGCSTLPGDRREPDFPLAWLFLLFVGLRFRSRKSS